MFPRPLTTKEKMWLKFALSLLPAKRSKRYLEQLDNLQVWDMCRCGDPNCHTVYFLQDRPKLFAIVHTNTDDGRELIIHADAEGRLGELEVI